MTFNLETGAPTGDLEAILDSTEKTFETDGRCAVFEKEKIGRIIQWVQLRAPKILEAQIEPFRDSMNRRFRRDVANLEEYCTELKQEMTENLKRQGLSEQLVQERKEKIRLIPDEMAKKKDDLFKKYSIKVKFELSGAMLIRTPAVKLFCRAAIGNNRSRSFTIPSTNPLILWFAPAAVKAHIKFISAITIICFAPNVGKSARFAQQDNP